MQRRGADNAVDSGHDTEGNGGGNTPVEIHRVLCGNNTRQNERPARRGVFTTLFEEYIRSEAGF